MNSYRSVFLCATLIVFSAQIVSAEILCGNCRKKSPDPAKFCSSCGTKLSKGKAQKKTTPVNEEKEPSYDGKTINQWIELLKNSEKEGQEEAIVALGQIGKKASATVNQSVEALTKALKSENPAVREAAKKSLEKIKAARNRSSQKHSLTEKSAYAKALETMREAVNLYRKAKDDTTLLGKARKKFEGAEALFKQALKECADKEKSEIQSIFQECKQYIYDCKKREKP